MANHSGYGMPGNAVLEIQYEGSDAAGRYRAAANGVTARMARERVPNNRNTIIASNEMRNGLSAWVPR